MELDAGIATLRITIGLIFAAHGAQKALGWWKGPGYAGWTAAIGKMGFRPVAFWTFISVAAELGAGLLLALGLTTGLTIRWVSRLLGVRQTLLPRAWRIYWIGVGVSVVAVIGILAAA